MGTHAMIGMYNKKDGSVTASYCHYDGYLEGVGRTLDEFYDTQYDAEVVAKGGYMSALYDDYMETRKEAVHNEPAIVYDSVSRFLKEGADYAGADYLYLWDGEAWFFAPTYEKGSSFEEVKINLKKSEKNC
jgi:hypothetical protein